MAHVSILGTIAVVIAITSVLTPVVIMFWGVVELIRRNIERRKLIRKMSNEIIHLSAKKSAENLRQSA